MTSYDYKEMWDKLSKEVDWANKAAMNEPLIDEDGDSIVVAPVRPKRPKPIFPKDDTPTIPVDQLEGMVRATFEPMMRHAIGTIEAMYNDSKGQFDRQIQGLSSNLLKLMQKHDELEELVADIKFAMFDDD